MLMTQTEEYNHVRYYGGEVHYLTYAAEGIIWCTADMTGTVKRETALEIPESVGVLSKICSAAYGTDDLWMIAEQSISEKELRYILLRLDETGSLLFSQELTDLLLTSPQEIAQQDDFLYIASDMTVYVLNFEGTVCRELDAAGEIQQLVYDSNGLLYCVLSAGPIYRLSENRMDLRDSAWELSPGQFLSAGCAGYDFLVSDREQLFGLKLDSGECILLLDWSDQALLDGMAQGICCSNDHSYLILNYNTVTGKYELLQLNTKDSNEEYLILRLGVDGNKNWLSNRVEDAVNQFNRTHDSVMIEIVTIESMEALERSAINGDAPDLICLLNVNLSVPDCVEKNLLVDLYSFLNTDEKIKKTDLVEAYCASQEIGGCLYASGTSFGYRTLIAQASLVGQTPGWSMSEFRQVLNAMPPDMAVMSEMTQTSFLSEMLSYTINTYVDLENYTCDFQCESFLDLLEISKSYFSQEPHPAVEYGVQSGEFLLEYQFCSGTRSVHTFFQYDEGMTRIGFPGLSGTGAVLFVPDSAFYGICAWSTHQEAAWSFLRELFSEEFQSQSTTGFPVLQSSFDNCMEELITNGTILQADAELFYDLVNGCSGTDQASITILNLILSEADAYFDGQRTAKDTAELIQSRVSVYLAEQNGS